MIKRYLIALCALWLPAALFAESASQLLSRAQSKLAAAQSVVADFTVTANGESAKGRITAQGNRYNTVLPQMTIWFDGRTQWTYVPSMSEVSIVEPTPEELAQTNPLSVMSALKGYKAAFVKSADGTKTVKLTPPGKGSEFKEATVTLNASTLTPQRITATLADGQKLTIVVHSLKFGSKLPDSTFKFDKSKAPKATLNDLR